jgi:ABC-type glycerol-3-phosphate transport system permease component
MEMISKVEAAERGKTLAARKAVPWYRRREISQLAHAVLVYVIIIPGAILLTLPFLWMLSTALKVPKQIFVFPPVWIPNPIRWQNFVEGWTKYVPFTLYMRNSLIITVSNVIGNLFSCSLAAYGFARLRARGKEFWFMMVLGTMMIPMWVTLIPQYVLFSKLHWTNTFLPLMVPAWFGWPFFIFLLRQFFMTIPRELDDAARIDGCSTWGILWRIILPLSMPALATVAVFGFIGNWNNFLGPLIYLRDQEKYTLALGLQRFQGVHGNVQYHYMMAVATITVLPIILMFFLAQRYFIRGIVMSGIKG